MPKEETNAILLVLFHYGSKSPKTMHWGNKAIYTIGPVAGVGQGQ